MERYKVLKELGDGSCGSVYKALDTCTYEIVAIKKMKRKFYFWEEYTKLREVRVLRKLNHSNVIKLKDVIRENNELFLIFEYMEYNLYQVMRERETPFSEEEIRRFISQLLHGLGHIHKSGYFHRDLKPENLLVSNDILKIADFGLAREVSSMPPYTEYVSTRWYRAPEVLLHSKYYNPSVDMWAAGVILAELFTLSPIFPGESEIDQLYKICCVLGSPDTAIFPGAPCISQLFCTNNKRIFPANLSDVIPNASPEAIDLILQLCSWDPLKRPTADEALRHPFFHVGVWIPKPLHDPLELKLSNMGAEPKLDLKLSDFGRESEDTSLGLTLAVKPSVPHFEIGHNVAESMHRDMMYCGSLDDHPQQSVFWSLISSDPNGIHGRVESSLSLSFSSMHNPPTGIPQSAGLSISPFQSNVLDGPFLAISSPLQRGHWL